MCGGTDFWCRALIRESSTVLTAFVDVAGRKGMVSYLFKMYIVCSGSCCALSFQCWRCCAVSVKDESPITQICLVAGIYPANNQKLNLDISPTSQFRLLKALDQLYRYTCLCVCYDCGRLFTLVTYAPPANQHDRLRISSRPLA